MLVTLKMPHFQIIQVDFLQVIFELSPSEMHRTI